MTTCSVSPCCTTCSMPGTLDVHGRQGPLLGPFPPCDRRKTGLTSSMQVGLALPARQSLPHQHGLMLPRARRATGAGMAGAALAVGASGRLQARYE